VLHLAALVASNAAGAVGLAAAYRLQLSALLASLGAPAEAAAAAALAGDAAAIDAAELEAAQQACARLV
jgi:hypothetical protein